MSEPNGNEAIDCMLSGPIVDWLLGDGDASAIGSKFGSRYVLEERLGGGRYALVYRATDERLEGRPVVVKTLVEEAESNTWSREKFADEATALARVDHPGVVKILDSGQTPDGRPYLVLEYIPGATLRERLSGDPLQPAHAMRLLSRLCDAVDALHAKGIIHRDLKPDNIVLRPVGNEVEPVIVDLGIASLTENSGELHETVAAGSPGYLAPEQIKGLPSQRSDVYSLGVLAAELIPKRSRPVRRVLGKACSYAEEDRYATAGEFARALNTAVSGRFVPSRRSLLTGIGLVGVGAAAATAARQFGIPDILSGRGRPSPIQAGNLLFPVGTSIIEWDSKRDRFVQELPLPPGRVYWNVYASIAIGNDGGILTNVRNAAGFPVVLALDSRGQFVAEVTAGSIDNYLQQIALDPLDPAGRTVLAGFPFLPRVLALNPFENSVKVRVEESQRYEGRPANFIGLAIDREGRLYASEFRSGEIRRYLPDGTFESVFCRVEPQSAHGLSMDAAGGLYVAQGGLHKVVHVSRYGRIIRQIVHASFATPRAAYLHPRDQILWVVNSNNSLAALFTAQGEFIRTVDLKRNGAIMPVLVPERHG